MNVEGIIKATDNYQLCCVCDVISFISCECIAIRLVCLKFKQFKKVYSHSIHMPYSRSCKYDDILETISHPHIPTLI
jgi:hypothetical protein